MKTERAIELLHRLQDEQFDGPHGDERREALEMAVRAIESNLVKESGGLVQDLVKDCIDRQQAIEAFEPTHYIDWYTPTIIETLEALPSVQPEVLACGSGELVEASRRLVEASPNDLISRQQAIDAVVSAMIDGADAELVEGVMELLPSAQPEPSQVARDICTILENEQDMRVILKNAQPERKTGKWIDDIVSYSDTGDIILANCSLCGYQMDVVYEHGYFKYCPNCGARMED